MWALPVVLVWIALLLVYGGFQEDDVYITFRYARNIALGHGFVFNVGEPHHFGSSAPLFTLIIAWLGVAKPAAIPNIGFALSALGLLFCALAALAFWWDGNRLVGLIAALLIVVNPLDYYSLGMEMPVQAALILWGLYFCKANRSLLGVGLLSTACLVRPDAVVALFVGFAYLVYKQRRAPLKELGVSLAVILPFVAWAWIYFASPLPATLSAKQAQVDSGIWRYFFQGTIYFLHEKYVRGLHMPIGPLLPSDRATPLPMWWIFPLVAATGLAFCRKAVLPLIWVAAVVIAYQLGGVTFNAWYIFPLGIGISVLMACAIGALPAKAGAPIGVVAAAFFLWYAFARAQNCVDGRKADYILAGRWLRDNTPPNASAGFCEIGLVGWYSDRPMVDPLGLIHKGLDEHVATRDFAYAFRKYRPNYILDCPQFTAMWLSHGGLGWIHYHYKPVITFDEPGYQPVTILRRDDSTFR